jgi:hypothetical protein
MFGELAVDGRIDRGAGFVGAHGERHRFGRRRRGREEPEGKC